MSWETRGLFRLEDLRFCSVSAVDHYIVLSA